MGFTVEYHCETCAFASGRLRLGWGPAPPASVCGGLASCEACRTFTVVNLAQTRCAPREFHCPQCDGLLTLLDGLADGMGCPRCRGTLHLTVFDSWGSA